MADGDLQHWAEMLGAAIISAAHEAAEVLGLDNVEGWVSVLVEPLALQRALHDEVIDIETLRTMASPNAEHSAVRSCWMPTLRSMTTSGAVDVQPED